jgi:7-cyano-7-deazaguanine reductase
MKALGQSTSIFEALDGFPTPAGLTHVVCTTDEVTAVCPITGQPDWYTVVIAYRPGARCVESKSLKLFLQTFREQGLFGEAFAAQLANVLGTFLQPQTLCVHVTQKPRGGIAIRSTARWTPAGAQGDVCIPS